MHTARQLPSDLGMLSNKQPMGQSASIFAASAEQIAWVTLWWTNKKLLNMAIEIVDFPIENGWIFPWQNVSSPEGKSVEFL